MSRSLRNESDLFQHAVGSDFSRRRLLAAAGGLVVPSAIAALTAGQAQAQQYKTARLPVDKNAIQPTDRDAQKFMQHAIELLRKGSEAGDGGPFGAVIVKNGEIIGEGWNKVVSGNDPTAHAEILAIRAACKGQKSFVLKGCTLYTSGEPCPMCLSAIYWAHVDRVFYGFSVRDAAEVGFDDRFIYEQLAKPLEQRKIPEAQYLGAEARALLKAYAAMPNRVPY